MRQCIKILDKNYNLIKTIEKINEECFSYMQEIAINRENGEVFLLDKHRIIVTDFDTNFIKYFGSKGDKNNQFNCLLGICFKNGYL